ncbi:LuxR family transcriptional regulator [Rouxiella sp. S1S-2]|nr:LuxR family transcriptional regulator [Rouxiella sp. S1S-2]
MEIIVSIVSNSVYNNVAINETIESFLKRRLSRSICLKYAYTVMNKKNPSEYFAITNYPDEWVKIYKDNNYQYIDPVVTFALNRILPFSWSDDLKNHSKLNIFDVSKKYEIRDGYTFVVHDSKDNLVSLSIIIDESNKMSIEYYLHRNKNSIQMLLTVIHQKITSLYIDNNCIKNFNETKKNDLLSKRESEVLYYINMGKTYQQISLVMKIKLTTVKFHSGNIMRKLHVRNTKQAVRVSTELNLYKITP